MAKKQNNQQQYLLDFERPLVELEERLARMRTVDADTTEIDLSDQISDLEARVDDLRQSIYENLTRWQRVQIARHPLRPYTTDYIGALTDNFLELYGDHSFKDDPAIVGGFGTFTGSDFGFRDRTVMLLGHQKGRDTMSRRRRRFGMPNPGRIP